VLVAVYVAIAALGDAHAWSGSDAGGKVATVKVMAERHSWTPDVGYWAARWDSGGEFHPLIYTQRKGRDWVQVTSLPFAYLGVPLWHLAGVNGLLAIPIAGSVLAALAARRLARELGARRGDLAFWLVGAASPVLFYATDFWEHSMGVGLGLMATALTLGRRTVPRIALAGLLFGLAGVIRTEILIYAVVLGIVVLTSRRERRDLLGRPVLALVAVASLALPLVVNYAAERAVLGSAGRSSTASSHVSAAGSELSDRAHDALLTSLALFPDDSTRSFVFGGIVLAALLVLGRRLRSPTELDTTGKAAAAVGVAAYAARVVDGAGFVPGLFSAAPAAGAGLSAATGRARVVAWTAIGALPFVWALQWRGQLLPQWGGRYVLLTGALLTVVAAVEIERAPRRAVGAVVIGLAAAVTLLGAAWHIERTNGVARAARATFAVPRDDVIVSGIVHLGREYGAFYGDRRWLSSLGGGDLRRAVAVAGRAGVRDIDVVQIDERSDVTGFTGWSAVGRRTVDFLGVPLRVDRYRRAG
jgi:hypothetical protein